MTTETKKRRIRNGIIRRGKTYSVFVDLGDQTYRRCPTCRRRYWTPDGDVSTCKRDGTPLEAPRSGRRQEWRSGFRTHQEARAAADAVRTEIRRGTHVARSKITVGEFAEEWLESMRTRVRETTWENYSVNVRSHVVPGIGSVPLQSLSPTNLNAFYARLLEGAPWRTGRPLSVKSVRNVHVLVSKVLADALDEDKIARNVAKQAKPPRQTKHEMRVWTRDQVNAFLSSVASDRLFALWRLACRTGMRRGELAGLRWSDVDLEAGELTVSQSLVIVGGAAKVQAPKTDRGRRTIALDETTVEALRAHRRRQIEERLAAGETWIDSGHVFTRETGEAIYPELLGDWFARAAKAAGLPAIRFHDVRHSYATSALEQGMPVMILSARLGHSTPALTLNVYSHALPATDRSEASRVAAALD